MSTPLNWAERLKIAQGAARGLAYIHACGGKHKLVHRDIKSSNILLDVDMEARISDLGLARLQNLAGGSVIAPKPAEGESLSTSSAPSSIQGLSGTVAAAFFPFSLSVGICICSIKSRHLSRTYAISLQSWREISIALALG